MEDKNLLLQNIDKLIGEKFGNYSKYIIQERALPDLRDGLKPVQRRILFAMNQIRLFNNSPYKKSARIVGDVIGKYHPHGDSSVYEAMVRLSQEWKLNIPLVDMHGNKGSIDGDSPAAMRYTETRLSKFSNYLLKNLEKELVDFSPNFDDSEFEPNVLPAQIPNLIINGSTGIASGYSTNIPPHNIVEIINALIFILQNNDEEITLSKIMKFVKGPDFPTGGIVNINELKEAYKHGKGNVLIQSKVTHNARTKELLITEIPFEVNKADLVKKIDSIIQEEKVSGLLSIRDDTDRNGLQITIDVEKKANVELINNYLFKNTELQKKFSINMVSIKNKKPEQMGLVDILKSFVNFQINIFRNLYKFELRKTRNRLEIVDGLIKVVDIIDEIIKLIRKSSNKSTAKEAIINKFKFTDRQAEAIVNLRLYRLTSTDIKSLQDEKNILLNQEEHFNKGLNEEDYLKQNIINELEEIKNEFNIPRRSQIIKEEVNLDINEKDLIKEEKVALTVSLYGYIKKISTKNSNQNLTLKQEPTNDLIISKTISSNMNNIILFTSFGRYYIVPIYKLKSSKGKDKGEHISSLTSIMGLEKIIFSITGDSWNVGDNINLLISTKKGMIKRIKANDLVNNSTKRGSKFISLKNEDEVLSIQVVDNNDYFVTSISSNANILRYDIEQVPLIGLSAAGVKNIKIDTDSFVSGVIAQRKEKVDNEEEQLIIMAINGKAKRIETHIIKKTSRASKGVSLVKQIKNNPFLPIGMFDVKRDKIINVLTASNSSFSFSSKSISLSEGKNGVSKISNENILECKSLHSFEVKNDSQITRIVKKDPETNLEEKTREISKPKLFRKIKENLREKKNKKIIENDIDILDSF